MKGKQQEDVYENEYDEEQEEEEDDDDDDVMPLIAQSNLQKGKELNR